MAYSTIPPLRQRGVHPAEERPEVADSFTASRQRSASTRLLQSLQAVQDGPPTTSFPSRASRRAVRGSRPAGGRVRQGLQRGGDPCGKPPRIEPLPVRLHLRRVLAIVGRQPANKVLPVGKRRPAGNVLQQQPWPRPLGPLPTRPVPGGRSPPLGAMAGKRSRRPLGPEDGVVGRRHVQGSPSSNDRAPLAAAGMRSKSPRAISSSGSSRSTEASVTPNSRRLSTTARDSIRRPAAMQLPPRGPDTPVPTTAGFPGRAVADSRPWHPSSACLKSPFSSHRRASSGPIAPCLGRCFCLAAIENFRVSRCDPIGEAPLNRLILPQRRNIEKPISPRGKMGDQRNRLPFFPPGTVPIFAAAKGHA